MNKRKVLVAFVTICLFAWSVGSLAMSPVLKEIEDGFVKLNEAVRPSVVNINTKMTSSTDDEGSAESPDLFRFFGIPNPEQGAPNMPNRPRFNRMATGTGLIYDKQGHIITNNHVVEGVEGENAIMVKLWNDKEYPAKVVGRRSVCDCLWQSAWFRRFVVLWSCQCIGTRCQSPRNAVQEFCSDGCCNQPGKQRRSVMQY